jgi:predicted RNase H-like HicB family nuclease
MINLPNHRYSHAVGALDAGQNVDQFFVMRQLTAILRRGEPDEGGFWATCLEVPGANGQGETREDCLKDLVDAVRLLIQMERVEAHRATPNAEEVPIAV